MRKVLRFPDFRSKAVTLSYDDADRRDIRLIEIMKKYGIKGTFNLNSGLLDKTSFDGRKTNESELKDVYIKNGMEIAVHGLNHIFLSDSTSADICSEFYKDRENLERLTGGFVRGSAYANGYFNDEIIQILKSVGIVYSRTCRDTYSFSLPEDWMKWGGTCHHTYDRMPDLLEKFLSMNPDTAYNQNPLLFYLWGHSHELNSQGDWDLMENFCSKTGNDDNVWKATNMEIYEYVEAYNRLVFTIDNKKVYNPSNIDVYALIDGKRTLIKKNVVTEL